MPVPINVATFRPDLDRDGCAFGQVSRERMTGLQDALDRVEDHVVRVEARLNYVLAAVGLQLAGAFIAAIVFLIERIH